MITSNERLSLDLVRHDPRVIVRDNESLPGVYAKLGDDILAIDASDLPSRLEGIGLTVDAVSVTADPEDVDGAAWVLLDLLDRYATQGIPVEEIDRLFQRASQLCQLRADDMQRGLSKERIPLNVRHMINDGVRFSEQATECMTTIDVLRRFCDASVYRIVAAPDGEFDCRFVKPTPYCAGKLPAFFSFRQVAEAAKAISDCLLYALKDEPDLKDVLPRTWKAYCLEIVMMQRFYAVFKLFLCDGDYRDGSQLAMCLELKEQS